MNPAQRILIRLIRIYQALLSPALAAFFGPAGRCRYTPACSHYARESIRLHGAVAGGCAGIWRICRCHPWACGGHDPVPPIRPASESPRLNPVTSTGHGS